MFNVLRKMEDNKFAVVRSSYLFLVVLSLAFPQPD